MHKLPVATSFLLMLLYSYQFGFAQVKQNKVRFELGKSFISFSDGSGLSASNMNNLVPKYEMVYMKCGYLLHRKYEVGVSTYWHSRYYTRDYDNLIKGDVLSRYYRNYNIHMRYNFLKQNNSRVNFQAYSSVQLNRRTSGRENIFLARRSPIEIITDGTRYRSWGVGVSGGVEAVFVNKIYVGAEFGFAHYFQQNNLNVEPKGTVLYNSYQVNKDVLFLHPKIGIFF